MKRLDVQQRPQSARPKHHLKRKGYLRWLGEIAVGTAAAAEARLSEDHLFGGPPELLHRAAISTPTTVGFPSPRHSTTSSQAEGCGRMTEI